MILIVQPPLKYYFGQVMYDVKRPGREWLMRFLLGKDLNALSEVCTYTVVNYALIMLIFTFIPYTCSMLRNIMTAVLKFLSSLRILMDSLSYAFITKSQWMDRQLRKVMLLLTSKDGQLDHIRILHRVSTINGLLLALKINLGQYEDYRFAWELYSSSFSTMSNHNHCHTW